MGIWNFSLKNSKPDQVAKIFEGILHTLQDFEGQNTKNIWPEERRGIQESDGTSTHIHSITTCKTDYGPLVQKSKPTTALLLWGVRVGHMERQAARTSTESDCIHGYGR